MTGTQSASPAASGSPRWLSAVVLGLAGLFYAYAIWNAVAHVISMAQNGLTAVSYTHLTLPTKA